MKKIAVAMSGGVDSSVSAFLIAKKYGKDNVFGVTLKMFEGDNSYLKKAYNVCEEIGIKHYVVDIRNSFKKEIIDYFVSEYKKGLTPNPCVKCNRVIKFGELFREATKMGASYVATGHYVIKKLKKGSYRLYKGKDESKDQSYFLYRLTQYELAHAIFPLGNLKKSKVKKIAKKLKLPTLESESQEVCFIETTAREFLKNKIKNKKGEVVHVSGKKLGKHEGAHFFTIGQRKGMGIAYTKPLYVVEIDIKKNRVILGEESYLYKKELVLSDTNWISGMLPKNGELVDVKIRYATKTVKAKIYPGKNKAKVNFLESVRAITPGQSAVFYRKNEVLGGGIIK